MIVYLVFSVSLFECLFQVFSPSWWAEIIYILLRHCLGYWMQDSCTTKYTHVFHSFVYGSISFHWAHTGLLYFSFQFNMHTSFQSIRFLECKNHLSGIYRHLISPTRIILLHVINSNYSSWLHDQWGTIVNSLLRWHA